MPLCFEPFKSQQEYQTLKWLHRIILCNPDNDIYWYTRLFLEVHYALSLYCICQQPGSAILKTEHVRHSSNSTRELSLNYIVLTIRLKSSHSWLWNQTTGCLWESFWKSIWVRNKTVIYKWLLTRGGHLEKWSPWEIELTVAWSFSRTLFFDLCLILDSEPACFFTITPRTKVVLLQSCVTRSVRIFVNVNVAGHLCKVLLNSFSDIHF